MTAAKSSFVMEVFSGTGNGADHDDICHDGVAQFDRSVVASTTMPAWPAPGPSPGFPR